jgi:hypothetical protein
VPKTPIGILAARIGYRAAIVAAFLGLAGNSTAPVIANLLAQNETRSAIVCPFDENRALDDVDKRPSIAEKYYRMDPSGRLFETDAEFAKCGGWGPDIKVELNKLKGP